MIYNLTKYIIANLPQVQVICNGLQIKVTGDCLEVCESGGTPSQYIGRKDYTIQIASRAVSRTVARKNVTQLYNLLHRKFGLVLPEETVDGQVFPSLRTWRIVGIAIPAYVGTDANGRHMFTSNYIITTEGE